MKEFKKGDIVFVRAVIEDDRHIPDSPFSYVVKFEYGATQQVTKTAILPSIPTWEKCYLEGRINRLQDDVKELKQDLERLTDNICN